MQCKPPKMSFFVTQFCRTSLLFIIHISNTTMVLKNKYISIFGIIASIINCTIRDIPWILIVKPVWPDNSWLMIYIHQVYHNCLCSAHILYLYPSHYLLTQTQYLTVYCSTYNTQRWPTCFPNLNQIPLDICVHFISSWRIQHRITRMVIQTFIIGPARIKRGNLGPCPRPWRGVVTDPPHYLLTQTQYLTVYCSTYNTQRWPTCFPNCSVTRWT